PQLIDLSYSTSSSLLPPTFEQRPQLSLSPSTFSVYLIYLSFNIPPSSISSFPGFFTITGLGFFSYGQFPVLCWLVVRSLLVVHWAEIDLISKSKAGRRGF
ncbi:unnamed protein product, partial [Linum tenue]